MGQVFISYDLINIKYEYLDGTCRKYFSTCIIFAKELQRAVSHLGVDEWITLYFGRYAFFFQRNDGINVKIPLLNRLPR